MSFSDLDLLVFMQTCRLKLSFATSMKRLKCLLPQMFLTLILQQFSITLSEESELSIHGTDSYLRFTGLSKNSKIPGKCLKSLTVNKIAQLRYFIIDGPVNATLHLCSSLQLGIFCADLLNHLQMAVNQAISFIILCSQERTFQFIHFGNCDVKGLKKKKGEKVWSKFCKTLHISLL